MAYIFSIYALLTLISTPGSIENISHVQIQTSSDIVFERLGEADVTVRDNEFELTVSEDSRVLIEEGLEIAEWREESKTIVAHFGHEYRFRLEESGKRVVTISGKDAVVTFKISTDQ